MSISKTACLTAVLGLVSDMAFAPGCGTLYVGMNDRIVAVRPAGVGACTAT